MNNSFDVDNFENLHCTYIKEIIQLNSWHYRMNIFYSISFLMAKLSHLVPTSHILLLSDKNFLKHPHAWVWKQSTSARVSFGHGLMSGSTFLSMLFNHLTCHLCYSLSLASDLESSIKFHFPFLHDYKFNWWRAW